MLDELNRSKPVVKGVIAAESRAINEKARLLKQLKQASELGLKRRKL